MQEKNPFVLFQEIYLQGFSMNKNTPEKIHEKIGMSWVFFLTPYSFQSIFKELWNITSNLSTVARYHIRIG